MESKRRKLLGKSILLFFILYSTFFIFSCGDKKSDDPVVVNELKDSSAYITKIFDYHYAPGQYASNASLTNAQNFVGKPSYLYTVAPSIAKSEVSLGGWGGYIVGGFNHNVSNRTGNDFIVLCGSSPSPEPAVVYVMQDTNGNGLPDDTWYELKGSEFGKTDTYRDYQVKYYKPSTASGYITWKDNKGNADTLKAGYGSSFTATWWKDAAADSVTFSGTRLPKAYYNNSSTTTQNWVVYNNLFTWGYGENANGTDFNSTYKGNEFDISNAVDVNGNTVSLPNIRFIKVQTGVFQQPGWLNEISSEIYGAADLNLLK